MRATPFIAVALVTQLASGCSTWRRFMGSGDEDGAKTTDDVVAEAESSEKAEKAEKTDKAVTGKATKEKSKPSLKDEQELKMARLWSRVDELEEQSLRNKERIRVLEKGITLGLVPEELKGAHNGSKKSAPANAPIIKEPLYDSEPTEKSAEKVTAKEHGNEPEAEPAAATPDGLSKEQSDQYQAALASAHDLYRSGRYGRAIVEYDKIGKDFAGKVEGGMHKYWIGKCWANLKEFNTARQILADFVTENASSPWLPRAKLELARVEWKLGMQDTALQRFKELIQSYPYEDAAEMAKMELENLGKTL